MKQTLLIALTLIHTACIASTDVDYLKARIAIALKLSEKPQVIAKAVDKRLRVEIWTATWCEPCKTLKKDIDAGKWKEFNVVLIDYDENEDKVPVNLGWLPCMVFTKDGKQVIYPHEKTPKEDATYDIKKWQDIVR